MTLPAGTVSIYDVNIEMQESGGKTTSLNDAIVRSLTGQPSGTVDMYYLKSKGRVTGRANYGEGTSYFTIPIGTKHITVNAVGGGGGSTGFHVNTGSGTQTVSGGSGGAVIGYSVNVNYGDVCTIVVGRGGSVGCYAKGGWCGPSYGGTDTNFWINGGHYFTAGTGGNAGGGAAGGGGGASFSVGPYAGYGAGGAGGVSYPLGYSIWAVIIPPAPAIQCPWNSQLGRAERGGFLYIDY